MGSAAPFLHRRRRTIRGFVESSVPHRPCASADVVAPCAASFGELRNHSGEFQLGGLNGRYRAGIPVGWPSGKGTYAQFPVMGSYRLK